MSEKESFEKLTLNISKFLKWKKDVIFKFGKELPEAVSAVKQGTNKVFTFATLVEGEPLNQAEQKKQDNIEMRKAKREYESECSKLAWQLWS
jgi:hypothetical protein